MWEILVWIVIGGLAGWAASKLMGTDAQQGVLMNIVVGIVGGLIGGWILGLFGLGSSGLIFSFITAVAGACLLLFVVRAITSRR